MEAYQFKPDSLLLKRKADGNWIADFLLSLYPGQNLSYIYLGMNSDNYIVTKVVVSGNEDGTVEYHPGQTDEFPAGTSTGVELVSEKDERDHDSIRTDFPPPA